MTTSTLDFPDGRRSAQIEVDDAAELHLLEPGLAELRLPAGSVDAMPVAIRLDLDGEVAWWTPSGAHGLGADWGSGAEVRSMSSAPVGALLGPDDDRAVLVVALSANVRRARLARRSPGRRRHLPGARHGAGCRRRNPGHR